MKYFSIVPIVLLAMAGTVRADHSFIDTTFVQITADSGHSQTPFVGDMPGGFTSWALTVETTSAFDTFDNETPPNPVTRPASWLGTELVVSLTEGNFYYDAFGKDPVTGVATGTPPPAAFFGLAKQLRFTSYINSVTSPDSPQKAPPTALLKDWDPVNDPTERKNVICCSTQGDPLSGISPTREDQVFAMVWGSEAGGQNQPGTHVIGILTISNDAQGEVLVGTSADQASAEVPAGTAPHSTDFSNWFVQDGAFVVPEPSSAVLAVIGLIGLAGVRRRRRA